jgi:hypothetical protein
MPADVGDYVHPWYKGSHEWLVKKAAKLDKPIEYQDDEQGQVRYDPKIMLLESPAKSNVLWFSYWMSTDKTDGKMKWGQRPPMLEEEVLLELLSKAIKKDMFSTQFLKKLSREIDAKTG